jgi:hypothetical protein
VLSSMIAAVPFASAQDQPAPTSTEILATCAPPPIATSAAHALRVIGAQDTVPRTIFGVRDLLIVNGGTGAGVQLGAEFFVRRASTTRDYDGRPQSDTIVTDGTIKIVAVNDTTSIAQVNRVCGAIFSNDFLEPFVAPTVPAVTDAPVEPDFSSLSHVLGGWDGHRLAGTNMFAILDIGSENGVQPGARFAIYRDLTTLDPLLAAPAGTPLTAIGEVVVVSTNGNRSVAWVVRARDAVQSGDYAAPAK